MHALRELLGNPRAVERRAPILRIAPGHLSPRPVTDGGGRAVAREGGGHSVRHPGNLGAAELLHLGKLERKKNVLLTHSCPPFQHLLSERLTSLGIMGEPRVPSLNPSETIVL